MKIAMICFTLNGYETAEKIKDALIGADRNAYFFHAEIEKGSIKDQISTGNSHIEELEIQIAVKSRYLEGSIRESVGKWTEAQFETQDAIIFVGATGIAVRSIAPYVVSKKSDPAVLVVDECGTYVISLLSGHLGGANELTQKVAEGIHAVPIVTTATDLHGRFAVDVFAKKNDCSIFNMKAAKEASAALLAGEKIGFYSEYPLDGKIPEGLIVCDKNGEAVTEAQGRKPRIGVAVSVYKDVKPFDETVVVVPKTLVMGIGCRKGKDAEGVKNAAMECLIRGHIYQEALTALASIDLKKEEQGILSLAEEWQLPFLTYTEEELLAVPGEYTPSAFVKKITGVDNVCERSAVLASGQGILLQRKVGADGVTTALARNEGGLKF